MLREHGRNVGVRKEIRCSPHDCRHYFAQKQLRNGIDVYSLSRLVGHYDTQITSEYLRFLIGSKKIIQHQQWIMKLN
nr:site-specific integrase [Rummeliibacillus suwonensis]